MNKSTNKGARPLIRHPIHMSFFKDLKRIVDSWFISFFAVFVTFLMKQILYRI